MAIRSRATHKARGERVYASSWKELAELQSLGVRFSVGADDTLHIDATKYRGDHELLAQWIDLYQSDVIKILDHEWLHGTPQ
jgi:hypothetical protein